MLPSSRFSVAHSRQKYGAICKESACNLKYFYRVKRIFQMDLTLPDCASRTT